MQNAVNLQKKVARHATPTKALLFSFYRNDAD
jgi:hypothetical protein